MMPSPARMQKDNALLVKTQRDFRRAADVIAGVWSTFPEVATVAVIGSVARPLWKEVPRFTEYRHRGVRLWHECKDVDLALWVDDQSLLGTLRRVMAVALRTERERCSTFGVADHQVDTFLFEPGTDAYLGRLCHFNACPKARPECAVAACGATPFNRVFPGFRVHHDILADVDAATLYDRTAGRPRSALNLLGPAEEV